MSPEIVGPIANPKDVPTLETPLQFMKGKGILNDPPRTPGTEVTGPAPLKPQRNEIPVQEMEKFQLDQLRQPGAGTGSGMTRSGAAPAAGNGAPAVPAADGDGVPVAGPARIKP